MSPMKETIAAVRPSRPSRPSSPFSDVGYTFYPLSLYRVVTWENALLALLGLLGLTAARVSHPAILDHLPAGARSRVHCLVLAHLLNPRSFLGRSDRAQGNVPANLLISLGIRPATTAGARHSLCDALAVTC